MARDVWWRDGSLSADLALPGILPKCNGKGRGLINGGNMVYERVRALIELLGLTRKATGDC
jgi:hypothetical protein